MSATGLDVFDKTLQTTNAWLNEIMLISGPIGISLGMYWARFCVPLVIVCQLASPLIWGRNCRCWYAGPIMTSSARRTAR